jgi:ISXO2-like transposase domain
MIMQDELNAKLGYYFRDCIVDKKLAEKQEIIRIPRFVSENLLIKISIYEDNKAVFSEKPHFPKTSNDQALELPRVHRVFSNLKAWMRNTHKFVSRKHLQNYLNEFIFRFDFRKSPLSAFNYVLYNAILEKPRIYRQFVRRGRIRYVNPLTGLPKYIS